MLIWLAVVVVVILAAVVWAMLALSAALDPDPVSQEWIHTHVRDDR